MAKVARKLALGALEGGGGAPQLPDAGKPPKRGGPKRKGKEPESIHDIIDDDEDDSDSGS